MICTKSCSEAQVQNESLMILKPNTKHGRKLHANLRRENLGNFCASKSIQEETRKPNLGMQREREREREGFLKVLS